MPEKNYEQEKNQAALDLVLHAIIIAHYSVPFNAMFFGKCNECNDCNALFYKTPILP